MAKTKKPQPTIEMYRMWDKYSESIGTDIDSLHEFAGTTVLTHESYKQLVAETIRSLKKGMKIVL